VDLITSLRFELAVLPISLTTIILQALYPKDKVVCVTNLKLNINLNDKTGFDYRNGRMGIHIDGIDNDVAIRPENLKRLQS
jgi:hypothetical protein